MKQIKIVLEYSEDELWDIIGALQAGGQELYEGGRWQPIKQQDDQQKRKLRSGMILDNLADRILFQTDWIKT